MLLFCGCAILEGPAPLVAQPTPSAAPREVVTIPRPSRPEELAAGFIEAMSSGRLELARAYYLSDEEFDALFNWPGEDPRPARDAQIMSALRAAAPALAGASFEGLAEPAAQPGTQIARGQRVSGLIFDQPASVLDGITAVASVDGRRRLVRLEGLVRVGDYWRLFSPTLVVQ